MPDEERDGIVREVAGHFEEAVAHGDDIPALLEGLGTPDQLAAAFLGRVEAQGRTTRPQVLKFVGRGVAPARTTASLLLAAVVLSISAVLLVAGAFNVFLAIASALLPSLMASDLLHLVPAGTIHGRFLAIGLGVFSLILGVVLARAVLVRAGIGARRTRSFGLYGSVGDRGASFTWQRLDYHPPRQAGLNENVVIEVGAMLMAGRPCALLKDADLTRDLPTDLVGHIYKRTDLADPNAVSTNVHRWAADDLGLGRCEQCPQA